MWSRATSIGVQGLEINRPIEIQASVVCDVDVQSFVVGRRIYKGNLPALHEIIRHDSMWRENTLVTNRSTKTVPCKHERCLKTHICF